MRWRTCPEWLRVPKRIWESTLAPCWLVWLRLVVSSSHEEIWNSAGLCFPRGGLLLPGTRKLRPQAGTTQTVSLSSCGHRHPGNQVVPHIKYLFVTWTFYFFPCGRWGLGNKIPLEMNPRCKQLESSPTSWRSSTSSAECGFWNNNAVLHKSPESGDCNHSSP